MINGLYKILSMRRIDSIDGYKSLRKAYAAAAAAFDQNNDIKNVFILERFSQWAFVEDRGLSI